MKPRVKANLFYYGIFFIIYFLIFITLIYIFENINSAIIGGISAAITVILAPQKKITKKQSGDEIQLKWLFSKRVINIK